MSSIQVFKKGRPAASARESDHKQSSVKGYKNQARKRKGVTTNASSKKGACTGHKSEEDIHLTLKNGTALRPVQTEGLQI